MDFDFSVLTPILQASALFHMAPSLFFLLPAFTLAFLRITEAAKNPGVVVTVVACIVALLAYGGYIAAVTTVGNAEKREFQASVQSAISETYGLDVTTQQVQDLLQTRNGSSLAGLNGQDGPVGQVERYGSTTVEVDGVYTLAELRWGGDEWILVQESAQEFERVD